VAFLEKKSVRVTKKLAQMSFRPLAIEGLLRTSVATALAFVATIATWPGELHCSGERTRALTDLSIEELMNEPVTSVSKKETKLSQSPAAVAVISGDDIRRLGITSIPEALRLVPGVEVARISAHKWAVSARGFNGQFADKLLVLVDGRTIYESSFPGVLWDIQDLVLEDLDRIEVIRGPGATLWGANAVNGVINIITKHTNETHGTLISTLVGSEDRPATSFRYGGQLGQSLHYRAYGKYFNRTGLVDGSGQPTPDDREARRAGLRMDWTPSQENKVMLESDFHNTDAGETSSVASLTAPFVRSMNVNNFNRGQSVQGSWKRTLSETSDLTVQSYYVHSNYVDSSRLTNDDMMDFEFQHHLSLKSRHDIVWGANYRHRTSKFRSLFDTLSYTRESYTSNLFTGFLQDEIALAPNRLHLILGSKIERNTFAGTGVHPSARLLWTPRRTQTVWAAVSRALRTPDLFELYGRSNVSVFQPGPQSPVFQVALLGSPGLSQEKLTAYELGYRIEPSKEISIDATAFYNVYDDLIDFLPGAPRFESVPGPAHMLLPQNAANHEGGRSQGTELEVQWKPAKHWKLASNYSFLHLRFLDGSREFDSPTHRAHFRSYLTLPKNLEFNSALYYAGRLRTFQIPAYVRADAGLTWKATKSLEVGVWGQNLLDDQHPEMVGLTTALRAQVRRSVIARVTWVLGGD